MATKRIYPEGCSEAFKRRIDSPSDHSAYAYGFSDEKPGWGYWARILAVLAIGAVISGAAQQCTHDTFFAGEHHAKRSS